MQDLIFRSACELAALVREKKVSPRELLEAHLDRVMQVNPVLNAIVDLNAERAGEEALALETRLARGEETGPLAGVPVTIKSSIDVAGLRSECGTKLRKGHIAKQDATLVARLREAGAIVVGTTNVPDLLMAYETDNLLYGRTNNPWDLEVTAGGSSGGESAAIASGCSAAGIGSDGGGSIRVPAHFCGLCGLKPTPGLIPRGGHWPACIGPSAFTAVVGPLARRVEDLQLLLAVTSGQEFSDPSSVPLSLPAAKQTDLSRLRVGWFEDDGINPVTSETRQAVRNAAGKLEEQGLRVEPFRLKGMESARDLWWTFFGVVATTLLAPMIKGREDDLHPIVGDLTAPVEEAEAVTYEKFLETWLTRDTLRASLLEQMQDHRVLLCPVGSIPAFRHGERSWTIDGREVTYEQVFTPCVIFNLFGNPSVVVPVGRSAEGLPIGVQLVGRPFEDQLVLAVAAKLEEALGAWQAPPESVWEAARKS